MSRYARAGGLLLLGAGGLAAAASTTLALSENPAAPRWIHNKLPPREEQVRRLSQGTAANPYDVLIIGGAGRSWIAAPRSAWSGQRGTAVPLPQPFDSCHARAIRGDGCFRPIWCRWCHRHGLRRRCRHPVRRCLACRTRAPPLSSHVRQSSRSAPTEAVGRCRGRPASVPSARRAVLRCAALPPRLLGIILARAWHRTGRRRPPGAAKPHRLPSRHAQALAPACPRVPLQRPAHRADRAGGLGGGHLLALHQAGARRRALPGKGAAR